jgi:hypothetical protein
VSHKNLIVDCICGNAFVASEAWCKGNLSAIWECRGLVRVDGVLRPCGEKYTAIGMLRMMERKSQCTAQEYRDLMKV